ncbi:uncharacterized protein LOC101263202 [Solanum lycopersicum]|uniref:uncharacterized protein LOC101263202 n=1 Tax=Solanum lycopersicum TaxID=4081 RepID=UPI0002BC8F23|nr:uncharacterized protein LOC101263202 [Solanum lycopersicum]
MKNNPYRKSTIHPITQPDHQLSLLPTTILTLTTSLSQEDKQILSYLISCSSSNFSNNLGNCTTHSNNNNKSCYCFNCYMSYWVKWDSSPNHQLIHEIIDAFENMVLEKKKGKNKKQRRNKNRSSCGIEKNNEICLEENSTSYDDVREEELGSVRRFVSFLGESIWSVWHV